MVQTVGRELMKPTQTLSSNNIKLDQATPSASRTGSSSGRVRREQAFTADAADEPVAGVQLSLFDEENVAVQNPKEERDTHADEHLAVAGPLLLPTSEVKPQYLLPAPRPVLMLPMPSTGHEKRSSGIAYDFGERRHCFSARHSHSRLHSIRDIAELTDPGESRLYKVLLHRCGTDPIASRTTRRDDPFEITVGRAELIKDVLRSKHNETELKEIEADKKLKCRETENARTEIKNALRGLTAKKFIERVYPDAEPYVDRIKYRVFISHQILCRLSELGAFYWRSSGPGRILVDSNGVDIQMPKADRGANSNA
jgi:hypothetical protein